MSRRSTSAIPKPQGYHHGDLRRALLMAARQLVDGGGAGALTLRAAAQQAGVSAAAPYRHFEDREALLAAVLAEAFHDLTGHIEAARVSAANPVESYLSVGRAYLQFAARHPRLYPLMFGAECNKLIHPELLDAGNAAFGVVRRAAQDCADAGLIGDRPADDVALAGWAMVHGIASLQADGVLGLVSPRTLPDISAALLSVLVEGVARRD